MLFDSQAYYFSDAQQIVGVEMNSELCELQNNVVDKYQMQDKIKVRLNYSLLLLFDQYLRYG